MTEPENAGSDPRSLTTSAVLDGDEWVINGHKWFTSNGIDADFFIVMCRVAETTGGQSRPRADGADHRADRHHGREHRPRRRRVGSESSDHCEVVYEDVRVPVENILGRVGEGHRAAQDRLGAGRIFHCMNVGRPDVARVRPDGRARAHPPGARRPAEGQAVHPGLHRRQLHRHPVGPAHDDQRRREDRPRRLRPPAPTSPRSRSFVPAAYSRVVDRAIQVWGAAGVSNDLPLAAMYLGARTLRLADGPDEVHKVLIAKNVLGAYENGDGAGTSATEARSIAPRTFPIAPSTFWRQPIRGTGQSEVPDWLTPERPTRGPGVKCTSRRGRRGAPGRDRTCDRPLRRRLLSPLSYGGLAMPPYKRLPSGSADHGTLRGGEPARRAG